MGKKPPCSVFFMVKLGDPVLFQNLMLENTILNFLAKLVLPAALKRNFSHRLKQVDIINLVKHYYRLYSRG